MCMYLSLSLYIYIYTYPNCVLVDGTGAPETRQTQTQGLHFCSFIVIIYVLIISSLLGLVRLVSLFA